jgi:hypothetical protein
MYSRVLLLSQGSLKCSFAVQSKRHGMTGYYKTRSGGPPNLGPSKSSGGGVFPSLATLHQGDSNSYSNSSTLTHFTDASATSEAAGT